MVKPDWGENLIENPAGYVSPEGTVYMAIGYYTGQADLTIEQVGLTVTGLAPDGSPLILGVGGQ
jgi:hypothetical protein